MLRIVPTIEKSGFEKLQAPFHRIKLTLKGGASGSYSLAP